MDPIHQPVPHESVIIRFAGDSGDGVQLTGTRFTEATALAGNDIATLPDFPAEIRAPAGTLAGVSGFQVQFASFDVFTPGDRPDVLVAMNPAALARNIDELPDGAVVIVDDGTFSAKNLARAGFDGNPLESGILDRFRVHPVPIARLTLAALADFDDLSSRHKERCKNFFALGLTFWMYGRSPDATVAWIDRRFGDTSTGRANHLALLKGYDFGVTAELVAHPVDVAPAMITPGTYRSITGNVASAYGFATAARLAGRPLMFSGYPITPASEILHELSALKRFDVRTIQAEDEIAAACVALGCAYGGAIALTASSGPGIALKGEAIGLAVSVELPLVIANIQRAGPSTGMPTKVEQGDLFLAMYGRNGEAPLVVLAPASPADCFDTAIEAVRIATKYMTPVMYLSDAYLANSAEPWRVPEVSTLPPIEVEREIEVDGFQPFKRDPDTLARPWAVPGTPGLSHRIGGLEKDDGTGHISYDPDNHQHMTDVRAEKIERIAHDIPPFDVDNPDGSNTLVLGWGSTYGAIRAAVIRLREQGRVIARGHLRHILPMPANSAAVFASFDRILVPELNNGQLATLLRGVVPSITEVVSLAELKGRPFKIAGLMERIVTAADAPSDGGAS